MHSPKLWDTPHFTTVFCLIGFTYHYSCFSGATLEGPSQEPNQLVSCEPAPELEIDRSLIIHRSDILNATIPFEDVWYALNEGVPSPRFPVTHNDPAQSAAVRLFQQWADTQNIQANAVFDEGDGTYPHCDDEHDVYGNEYQNITIWNGFEAHCPRPFGKFAHETPLAYQPNDDPEDDENTAPIEPWFQITPLAIINRFDLTPNDYSTCGEVRLVYALRAPDQIAEAYPPTEQPDSRPDLFHFILEAELPNPHPGCASQCRALADTWASLSAHQLDNSEHREQIISTLRTMLFDGIHGFEPVVKWQHYSGDLGQIRTNQFVAVNQTPYGQGEPLALYQRITPWTLKEFQPELVCRRFPLSTESDPIEAEFKAIIAHHDQRKCELVMIPKPVDAAPPFELFTDEADEDERVEAFQHAFIQQIPTLLMADDLNTMSLTFEEEFLGLESREQQAPRFPLPTHAFVAWNLNPDFEASIQQEIDANENPNNLGVANLIARTSFLTCAGCHELAQDPEATIFGGDLTFDNSPTRFVHISDEGPLCGQQSEATCYKLSGGLLHTFLPHRRQVMLDFLNDENYCAPCDDTDGEQSSNTISTPDVSTLSGKPYGGAHH